MDPAIFLTIIINGLCTGGVYGVVASAFTFQLGALRIVNFSYGAFLMLAMFGVFILVTKGQLPLTVAAAATDGTFPGAGSTTRQTEP